MKRLALAGTLFAAWLHAQSGLPAGSSSPADADADQRQLQTAEDLLQKNEFAKARDMLATLLKAHPKNARAAYELGFADEQLNDDPAAETAYRSALAADPKQFESRLSLGLLLARNGDFDAAREQLTAAVALNPVNGDNALKATAYRALARIDAGKRNSDAQTELLEALKLSPETADDRQLAAQIASSSGDPADAEAAYRKILQSSPGDPQASIGLARLLGKSGKSGEAEQLLLSASKKHPDDPAVAARLASLYAADKRFDLAVPILEQAHQAHPDEDALSRMLARLYVQAGTPEKSSPLYEALLKSTPSDPILLDEWGDSLIQQKRFPEAQHVLEKALAHPDAFLQKQDLAAAAAHLAFAASANQDANTTLRALAVRDQFVPPSASSIFLSATAHDRLHHTKQAVALYRQFLEAANGRFPNEEWEAKHRILTLEHAK